MCEGIGYYLMLFGGLIMWPTGPGALCVVILGGILGILSAIIIRHFIYSNFVGYNPMIGFRIINCIYLAILGFAVSFVEEVSRKTWLAIVYKTDKTSSVALGITPVSFGTPKKALVRLPRYSFDQNAPYICAVFIREYDGGVFVRDCLTGTLMQLANGSCVDLGTASVIVHIAERNSP
jgi:hypothetical protein